MTTQIGKNSEDVRKVFKVLVTHGAPDRILVDGKPHLGTDRLVKILKSMREYLISHGAIFLFDTTVEDIIVNNNQIKGVQLCGQKGIISADVVILAIGHSARKLYEKLLHHGVQIECKPIAVGFRIEHPQELINRIQFGSFGLLCENGVGRVPVADYRLATQVTVEGMRSCYSFCMCPGG